MKVKSSRDILARRQLQRRKALTALQGFVRCVAEPRLLQRTVDESLYSSRAEESGVASREPTDLGSVPMLPEPSRFVPRVHQPVGDASADETPLHRHAG